MEAQRINIKELKTEINAKLKQFKKYGYEGNRKLIHRYGRWNIEEDFIQENNKPHFEKDRPSWGVTTANGDYIGFWKFKLRNIKTRPNKYTHESAVNLYKAELYVWCKMYNLNVKKSAKYRELAEAIFVAHGEPLQ